MLLSPAEEEKLSLVKFAQDDLLAMVQLLNKQYEAGWFHEDLARKLEAALSDVVAGRKVRLIITVPPRSGKTELAGVNFPAWALGKYPHLKFIFSTYGMDLSEKKGAEVRDKLQDPRYQAIFPKSRLRQDTASKSHFRTTEGGSYTAVGIGSALTGIGGNVVILDDPHKDRAEAESKLMRDNVWNYYQSTLYSRLEGYGAIIVIMQRWHQDDLVGRLMQQEEKLALEGRPHDEWEIVNYPAIAQHDEEHRKEGEALWPEKFPLEILHNIRENSTPYIWSSQYMQDPILAENQEFREDMIRRYNEEDLRGKYLRYYTVVDPAISQKKEADNTVVLTIAKEVHGPNIYRIREDAGRYTPTQTIDLVFKHQHDYQSQVYVETVAYQQALKFFIEEEQRKKQAYFTVHEVKTRSNKEERIRGLVPMYERGVIFSLPGDREFENELYAFPRGRRDDRVDALSIAVQQLDNTRTSIGTRQFKPRWAGYGRKSG